MKLPSLTLLLVFGIASAQTPPIQPQTPDVKIPPALVLPPPPEIAIGSQELTAAEVGAIALRNQPLMGLAQGSLMGAQGRAMQARSDLLPNFVASAGYAKSTTFRGTPGTGSSGAFSTSVSIEQLLFDFGRTRDTVRQQEAVERALGHSLNRTQQTVVLNAKESFYNFAQARQNVTISEANVANRQRQLDQAQARLNSGLGAPSDLVQAKTNMADAAISLTSARDALLGAQIQLAQAMGIDPRTPIRASTANEPPVDSETDVQRLVVQALQSRPDILAAKEQVSAAKYGVSAAQKGNLPRITASVGAGSRGATDPFATQTGTFSINVNWNFADSGFTAGAVRAARGSEQTAVSALQQVTQQAVADVSDAYVALQSALQRVDLAAVGVANAQELVRISEGRFTGGIGTFLEVTNAQASLVAAQRNQSQAQDDVQRARARLRAAIGGL